LHLQLKPGTDIALANGMLHVLIEEKPHRSKFHRFTHERWQATPDLAIRAIRRMARLDLQVPGKIVEAARMYGRNRRW